ncbi:MAG: VOC family protein [Terricaulis sp.]
MRLRQIALVAKDLDAARADIAAVFGVDYAYDDPGVGKYGLRNAVFPIGMTFLEVVSPKAEGATAGRLLEKRGGDGGYMVILQTPHLAEARARIRSANARIVDEITGDGFAFTHIHPRDIGGAILSVDWMDPPERWQWGGPEWRNHISPDPKLAITGAELQAEAPDTMAKRWAEVLGCVAERSGSAWTIALTDSELRFVALQDDRGEGLRAFDVASSDSRAIRAAAQRRDLVAGNGDLVLSGTYVCLVDA